MPSVTTSLRTVVLGENGWLEADMLPSNSVICGIDRRGLLDPCEVKCEKTNASDTQIYIGGSSTFGVFAGKSQLILRSGTQCSAQAFADEHSLSSAWFETHLILDELVVDSDGAEAIWRGINRGAAFSSQSRLAVRRTGGVYNLDCPDRLSRILHTQQAGHQLFLIIQRGAFDEAIADNWADTIIELCEFWLFDSGSKRTTFRRDFGALTMWYISALRSKNIGYALRYDSGQSTEFVYVERKENLPSPYEEGKCVCYGTSPTKTIRLSWSSKGWTPLFSGYLIGCS